MKPIIVVMFCVQGAILLVTIYIVALRKPTAARPGPIWSSVAVSLVAVGMVSNEIAQSHARRSGADVLSFTRAILVGMALMATLILFKERRG